MMSIRGWALAFQLCSVAVAKELSAQNTGQQDARGLRSAIATQFGNPFVEVRVGSHPSAGGVVRVVITDSVAVTATRNTNYRLRGR